jgi:hypothetical protein
MTGALMVLVLAADLTPPPSVEAVAPEAREEEVAAPAPEVDVGAQVTVSLVQTLNGLLLGIAACGATPCYLLGPTPPTIFGAVGAGAGLTVSLLDHDLARDWGTALMVDSITIGAALIGSVLATRPLLALGQTLGYSAIFLTDAALTAGGMVLARYVSPKATTVLLADTLGLWGLALGAASMTLLRGNDPALFMSLGALAGAVTGALLGVSAQRVSALRLVLANLGALAGVLLLGGGLSFYEAAMSTRRPYDPVVPAAGSAAGIAGGFLVAFALSEGL